MLPELTSGAGALVLTAIAAYLLGSVPFGLVLARLMGLGNLREIGSGNIGATNVLRTGNKAAAEQAKTQVHQYLSAFDKAATIINDRNDIISGTLD